MRVPHDGLGTLIQADTPDQLIIILLSASRGQLRGELITRSFRRNRLFLCDLVNPDIDSIRIGGGRELSDTPA